jgi:uncharacterized membrane protein
MPPASSAKRFLTLNRLEALSDGVFAVAITLLVFDIKIPELAENQSLAEALIGLWPNILTYILSFAIVGIFWMVHHMMFKFLTRTDRYFSILNIIFLMCISTVPFAAALLSKYFNDVVAVMVYGLIFFFCSLAFLAMWRYASYHRRFVREDMSDRLITIASIATFSAPIIYGFAVLVSLINPAYGLMIYLVAPIIYLVPSPIDRLVEE